MILEVPEQSDFQFGGLSFLNIAWDIVIGLLVNLDEATAEKWVALDEISLDYWGAAARRLATALALTQQGLELLVKGRIVAVSPYLLLAAPPREWRGGAGSDVYFGDLKTVDSGELIKLHNTVYSQPVPETFQTLFEDLRRRRNSLLHTVDKRLSVTAHEVVAAILSGVHHLVGPEEWLGHRTNYLESAPESVAFSPDHVHGRIVQEAVAAAELLKPAEAQTFLGFEKRARRYSCPECSHEHEHVTARESETATLRPNEPTSTTLWCFACRCTYDVVREPCTNHECPGNVIAVSDRTCRTCGRFVEESSD